MNWRSPETNGNTKYAMMEVVNETKTNLRCIKFMTDLVGKIDFDWNNKRNKKHGETIGWQICSPQKRRRSL